MKLARPAASHRLTAATQSVPPVTNNLTPIYRNITFSNINATSVSGYPDWHHLGAHGNAGDQHRASTGSTFPATAASIFTTSAVRSSLTAISKPRPRPTRSIYNAQAIITNSAPTNTLFTFDGLTTNGYGNTFAFYNALGSLENTNALDDGPLTLSASTLTVSNNLTLFPTTVLNYALGTNTTKLAVVGTLTLGGTNNIFAGSGFTNGIYTVMTYTGSLNGSLPVLGTKPPGYNYTIYNSAAGGQINLNVTLLAPTNLVAAGTNLLNNLKWNSVAGANTYNLKRGTTTGGPYPTIYSGLTATNYADANVTNAVNYFYVVTAVGAGGESSNSLQAIAAPLPSNQPTNILAQTSGGQLQLSWPQDHLGWRLQIQTNSLSAGISTNWATVANSTNVMQTNIVINPTNGAVFLRLVYP